MSDDERMWVATTAHRFNALVFMTVGRFGTQPFLFRWSLVDGVGQPSPVEGAPR